MLPLLLAHKQSSRPQYNEKFNLPSRRGYSRLRFSGIRAPRTKLVPAALTSDTGATGGNHSSTAQDKPVQSGQILSQAEIESRYDKRR